MRFVKFKHVFICITISTITIAISITSISTIITDLKKCKHSDFWSFYFLLLQLQSLTQS